jgi:hypothetical protein
MSNFKKIEEQEFKTIKRYDSGMLELYMNNYIVRLQTKDNVFNITLIEDGKDLNIPNKFDKTDSIDALFFFEHISKAVKERVEYDNNCKKEEKIIQKRFRTGEVIPSLSLINDAYKIITNDNY